LAGIPKPFWLISVPALVQKEKYNIYKVVAVLTSFTVTLSYTYISKMRLQHIIAALAAAAMASPAPQFGSKSGGAGKGKLGGGKVGGSGGKLGK